MENTHITDIPHPVTMWMLKSTSAFASSLRLQHRTKGYLTERQISSVMKAIEREESGRFNEDSTPKPPEVTTPLMEALNAAHAKGFKPKIHIEGYVLSRAGDDSRIPGAVYVVDANTKYYIGKIVGMNIEIRQPISVEDAKRFETIITNPKEEAIRYGRITGNCSCCGRQLTNKSSIEAGIGPICQEKFGW